MRNPRLTPAGLAMLTAMRDGKDGYAISEGLQVWVDLKKFHRSTLNGLLRYCLVSEDAFSNGKTQTWVLNEEGRKIIDDPDYVPLIIAAIESSCEEGTEG